MKFPEGTGVEKAEQLAIAAMASMPGVSVLVFDRDFRFGAVFGAAVEAHGYDPGEMVGRTAEEVLPPAAWERVRPFYERTLRGAGSTFDHVSIDGTRIYETSFSPIPADAGGDGDGAPIGGMIVARDVTTERRAVEALSESEQLYRMISETSSDVVSRIDRTGRYTFVSQASRRLYGWDPEELLGQRVLDFLHPHEQDEALAAQVELLGGQLEELTAQYRYRCADGSWLWVEKRIGTIAGDDGEIVGLQSSTRDISERKGLEAQLRHEARHDPLTGLWNRAGLDDEIQRRIAEARRYQLPAVLMLLDLDGLKPINDAHGHDAGDRQLVAVARAIEGAVRESDFCARFGGDEFALLLPHTEIAAARIVADRVAGAVRAAGGGDGTDRGPTTASIGIAALDAAGGVDEWLRSADLAMYEAKRAGGDQLREAD